MPDSGAAFMDGAVFALMDEDEKSVLLKKDVVSRLFCLCAIGENKKRNCKSSLQYYFIIMIKKSQGNIVKKFASLRGKVCYTEIKLRFV
jgi:hypothetical protein